MLHSHPKGTLLKLHVQPGASKTELSGLHGDSLKIRVHAPPVDGKANQSLVEFLSEIFQVPKRRVHLLRGETNRQKTFLIENISTEQAKELLRSVSNFKF